MESVEKNWYRILENAHLIILIIASFLMPIYSMVRIAEVLALVGILIGLQCYDFVAVEGRREHKVCLTIKIGVLWTFLLCTGLLAGNILYYLLVNPRIKGERKVACLLAQLGLITMWFINSERQETIIILLIYMIFVAMVTVALYYIEELFVHMQEKENELNIQLQITALNELKVRNLNRELAIKYQLADQNARLEERENIARNIHNVVGHTITSAIVSLQAYRAIREIEPQRGEDKLEASTQRMRSALEEIRRAVRLMDQETEIISIHDFCQILKTEIERFSMDTEIKVSHNLDEIETEQDINKRCCEFLHSVVAECLSNGIRHGRATAFLLLLQCYSKNIKLSIIDNGVGFSELNEEVQQLRIERGYGIKKIQRYVLEHGGKVDIKSENGLTVMLNLPLF